ncbi:hypothetical protein Z948_2513 [Sulfitobacter donghicola DSW-25 = KCTC 12864 = JCM 14565]|uniref:Uncharacterized protein n=1 Tax=Sulfitobacter donghicola DSW-25 = KCTC 12864 = JCM 14565 TaxID=1300350 RepID=A0A073IF51_9RHOB|nr:hypothetical protein DSW25_16070 [Sulfitobacter donghicola DSW-25 = KCTC 12864 = JCM 14565]KIN68781.1 hypothetical protein Z948_2513 [Sulfitobacter donghicola DSW-25 = KCTC 12864 = JCM 14565]
MSLVIQPKTSCYGEYPTIQICPDLKLTGMQQRTFRRGLRKIIGIGAVFRKHQTKPPQKRVERSQTITYGFFLSFS